MQNQHLAPEKECPYSFFPLQNQYRWVVWKLARLELLLRGGGGGSSAEAGAGPASSPQQAQRGQLLTAAVVLDELKARYVLRPILFFGPYQHVCWPGF